MNNAKSQFPKKILTDLFNTALRSVHGRIVVEQQLKNMAVEGEVAIVAIGKAAAAMMSGAKNVLSDQIQSALIITKAGHTDSTLNCPCIEAGHPIPDAESLKAGTSLINFLKNIPKQTKFLALISGGASALVEVLPDDIDLDTLQKINNWLLASGLTIHEINQIRQSISLIKGGKALAYLAQHEMTQLLISDVQMDAPEIIGSGLFVHQDKKVLAPDLEGIPEWIKIYLQFEKAATDVAVETHIIASNEIACQAIINYAEKSDYEITYHGQNLYGDVFELAQELANKLLSAKPGLHLWGGETTLSLPSERGRGGRNQSLALALACLLENNKEITILVGATDGSDGPTDDAGAIIDGFTLQRAKHFNAKDYLAAADAGSFLAEAGDLISTGPTGTNVMDIVIALKEPV